MIDNSMKLQFLSKSQNESFARISVASFASQLDLTIDELTDIKTAVSEAVTNAIIHGYKNSSGVVNIECIIRENRIEIIVEDNGDGIGDIDQSMKPVFTSKSYLERSGMGFTIMETFMDSVVVVSKLNGGTKVKMTKEFKNNSVGE